MSAHLIHSAANAQRDDRLRSAAQRRLAAQAPARRSRAVARPRSRRLGLSSLRAVLG